MKNFAFITLIVFLFVSSCSECSLFRSEDCEKHYEFNVPVSIYPVKDTFHIGDTIWIEIVVNDLLVNQLDGETIDISKLELKFDVSIGEYYPTDFSNSRNFFDYVNIEGRLQPYGSFFLRMVYA